MKRRIPDLPEPGGKPIFRLVHASATIWFHVRHLISKFPLSLEADISSLCQFVRLTLISQFAFNVGLYYAIPGYYPAAQDVIKPLHERVLRLVANHYLLSFGMYWMHRALHVVPWLWEKIHSFHHWAKHPLSRNTYDDHWLDNLGNAVIGHFCAQVLIPLDHGTFWFSHLIRIFESLEKHSGVSCGFNLAHQLQRFLPFAQMPHHHDWHHEGHKGCNYTFTSMGGLWDCIFGTRKNGRALEIMASQTTLLDRWGKKATGPRSLDHPVLVLAPVFTVAAVAFTKLHRANYSLLWAEFRHSLVDLVATCDLIRRQQRHTLRSTRLLASKPICCTVSSWLVVPTVLLFLEFPTYMIKTIVLSWFRTNKSIQNYSNLYRLEATNCTLILLSFVAQRLQRP